MKPFLYLVTRKAKNTVRESLHRPSRIIFMLFFLAILAFSFYTSSVSTPDVSMMRDKTELYAIVFALYTYAFYMTAKNGFINGASMFSMADVNLMFTAPLKEKSVLTFGLFQQLGKSLTLGIFILYQSSLVNNIYGLPVSALFSVLIGYGAVVFLGQMTATVIYALTCSDDKRTKKGKVFFYGVFAVFSAVLLYNTYTSGMKLESLVYASRERIMYLFPVSGFISFTVQGVIEEGFKNLVPGAIIFTALCILFYFILSKIKGDFYEDVLKATQISHSAITARKEGKAAENAPRNIKIGKTGIGKGYGASAITFKHKKENKRSNPFLLSPVSFFMAGFSLVYCLMFSGENLALFVINVYTMSMTVCIGRWAKEFTYPYVYLIPESNFRKLLCLLRADIPLLLLESVICFIPLVVLGSCGVIEGAAMTVARFTFGLLFIGVNLILQRFTGDSEKKVFSVMIYFLLAAVFSLPSVAVGILTGIAFPFNAEISYISMAILNTAVSFLLIYLCRNVLEYAEYNNR
ncbi:MAG: putative ABC exporter domain-containing protein [Clostridia bacterium]|nr:putative ABC exporter domain-containing protein [Clostridia bacterium]